MNHKLRATAHSGSAAIINALAGGNLSDLALKLGLRRPTRLHELAFSEKAIPATVDELTNLCAVLSNGVLRYVAEADSIVTDSTVALRTALIGRDIAFLADEAEIPSDFLTDYREGRDCLSREDLDILVVLLFDGTMSINHEALTLNPVGAVSIAKVKPSRRRRAAPYPSATTDVSFAGRSISLDVRGFPPVATGAAAPGVPVLKPEAKRAGYDRMMAKAATIPGMLR